MTARRGSSTRRITYLSTTGYLELVLQVKGCLYGFYCSFCVITVVDSSSLMLEKRGQYCKLQNIASNTRLCCCKGTLDR